MKILKFDSIGGASGDMILGALIPLGVDLENLNKKLSDLLPQEKYNIVIEEVVEGGISGVKASVQIDYMKEAEHHHRTFPSICTIIQQSRFDIDTQNLSIAVFKKLAEVEAKIHGTTIDKIHFHEVGAIDSIVDIVGSCAAFIELKIDAISLDHLPIGYGTIKCAHGIMPIPAPATSEILKNFPVIQTDEPFELVTPTGAALLMAWPAQTISTQSMIKDTNYSFGQRKLNNRPNMLRATVYQLSESQEPTSYTCTILETNLDDCTPEIIGETFSKLLKCGALDVFTTPITMKAQRPGVILSVLCEKGDIEQLQNIIFRETKTFGIRQREVSRTILDRQMISIETKYGTIQVKLGYHNGECITVSPEIKQCISSAHKHNTTINEVFETVITNYRVLNNQES